MGCEKRGLACNEQPSCRALIPLPVSVSASTWKSLSSSLSPNELQSECWSSSFCKGGVADLWQGHGDLMRQQTTLYQMLLLITSLLVKVQLQITMHTFTIH